MTNHIHLLVEPIDKAENLALLACRQTRYVNKLEGRCGTLWEGRYKSSPVDRNEYLLACCHYVELNPVRAGIAVTHENYGWSSFRQRAGLAPMEWLDADPCYIGLGDNNRSRALRYREWVKSIIPKEECDLIRNAAQRGQLTGTQRFVEEIAAKVGRRIAARGQGRPKGSVK